MALPTIFWFREVRDYVAKVVPFVASVLAFVAWCYNAIEVMIVAAFNTIKGKILSLDTSWMQSADFGVLDGIAVINSFAPVSETIGLLSALFAFKLVIYLVRWVKSFIPTVAN
jgi:hypothetical protein